MRGDKGLLLSFSNGKPEDFSQELSVLNCKALHLQKHVREFLHHLTICRLQISIAHVAKEQGSSVPENSAKKKAYSRDSRPRNDVGKKEGKKAHIASKKLNCTVVNHW